jgi:hypothetical protein
MWHFTDSDKILRYHDGREVVAGETLKVSEPIELCTRGLHASKRLIDALSYAPGPYVWFVKLSGTVIHGDDKSVATERTAVWGFDATDVLRKFSRTVALESIQKYWDKNMHGTFPKVVEKWLTTGDESLRSAARLAAESAARLAAESAAGSAAWSAAWAAARSVVAAESAQNETLTKMIRAAKRNS